MCYHTKMIGVKLTPLQMRFCHEYLRNGFDKYKAYEAAGGGGKYPGSVRNVVDYWMKNSDFTRYLEELQAMAAEESGITAGEVLQSFKKIREAAFDCGDYNNANKANEHLAKHLGLFVDRSEQKIEHVHRDVADIDREIEKLQRNLED